MRKMWLLGLVFALVLVGGTAYAGEPIKLGMSTWLGYAPLYLAKEKGFFQKRGMEVEIVVIESPADRRAAFAADKIQGMATTVDTHVMTAAAENPIPVKQVLALDDSHGGDGIVAKKEIKTVKDLKGKTVAAQLGAGASYFWLNYVLSQNGMKLSDIKAVDMKAGDAGAAFVAGQGRCRRDLGALALPGQGDPLRPCPDRQRQDPRDHRGLAGLQARFPEEAGGDVKKIVAAWNEAVKFAAENPEGSRRHHGQVHRTRSPRSSPRRRPACASTARRRTRSTSAPPQKPGLLYKVTQRAADLWFDLKLIKTKPKAADLIDGSFL